MDTSATERSPLLGRAESFTGSLHGEIIAPKSTAQSMTRVRIATCALGLGCLVFLQTANVSLVTTTQSEIARDLDAYDQTSWLTSAFLIPASALGPLCGKLSATYTPRTMISVAAIIFAIGSSITSVAQSFDAFILGRVICGVGSSGIAAISTILVLEMTEPAQRGIAIGLLNSGFTLGVAMGAVIAGALLQPLGWRAIFWLQVPVVILAAATLFLSYPTLPKDGAEQESAWKRLANLDYLGALLLSGAITLMLYALSSPKDIPILPLVLAAAIAALFVVNEIYLASDPILPLSLLKSRGLYCTCLSTIGYMMSRWSVIFTIPAYAIAVRDWSPALAGSILIPTNVGFAVGGLLVGWLHIHRTGSFYWPLLLCYALFPLTLVALAFSATQTTPPWLIIALVAICGMTTGAAHNYNLAHLLHLIPPETTFVATAFLATSRGFASSFGSAIGGGFFARTLKDTLQRHFAENGLAREELVRKLLGSPALVNQLQGVEHEIAVHSYEESVRTLWLAAAGLAVVMVLVQAGTGQRGYDQNGRKALADDSGQSSDED